MSAELLEFQDKADEMVAGDLLATARRIETDLGLGQVSQGFAMEFLARMIQVAADRGLHGAERALAEIRSRVALMGEGPGVKFDSFLKNVAIFKPGSHTDSMGREKTFSKADLQSVIDAFSQGAPPSVPVKLGHSDDGFNEKVAAELGIPTSALTGDSGAKGQVRLGEVTALKLNGHLVADLRLNEGVANLVTKKFLTGVSAELQFDRKQGDQVHPIALSGLALLGAQRPALSDLPTLQQATMLDDGSSADAAFLFDSDFVESMDSFGEGSMQVPAGEATDGKPGGKLFTVPIQDASRGRSISAVVSAADEISAKSTALRVVENFLFNVGGPLGTILGGTLGAIAATRLVAGKPILGGIRGLLKWKFDEPFDAADIEAARERYQKLARIFGPVIDKATKITGEEQMKEELAKTLNLADDATEAQILEAVKSQVQKAQENGDRPPQKEFQEIQAELVDLRRKDRIHDYEEETSALNLIPGKPRDRAIRLAEVEASAGKDAAKALLGDWQQMQKFAEEAGITRAILDGGADGNVSTFDAAVSKFAAEKSVSVGEATKAVMKDQPDLYMEHRRHVQGV